MLCLVPLFLFGPFTMTLLFGCQIRVYILQFRQVGRRLTSELKVHSPERYHVEAGERLYAECRFACCFVRN